MGAGHAFGAIARLGSGQWAQAAVPLGFYLGCLAANALRPAPAMPVPARGGVPVPARGGVLPAVPLAAAFVLFAVWRLARGGGDGRAAGHAGGHGAAV